MVLVRRLLQHAAHDECRHSTASVTYCGLPSERRVRRVDLIFLVLKHQMDETIAGERLHALGQLIQQMLRALVDNGVNGVEPKAV